MAFKWFPHVVPLRSPKMNKELDKELRLLLRRIAQELDADLCPRCSNTMYRDVCSTCEAAHYAEGDAFTASCFQCRRGFVTADPRRDLCVFCMKRTGEFNGRNRQASATPSCGSPRPTREGPSGTEPPQWTRSRAGPTLKDTRIRTGEIIAHRAWFVTRTTDLRLRSMAVDCIWEPGEVMSADSGLAQCGYADRWKRLPPSVGPGIHAFKDVKEAARQYSPGNHRVFGTVALWGEVIEHELGYRAEFGRVNTLDYLGKMRPKEQSVLRRLQKVYGVENKSCG